MAVTEAEVRSFCKNLEESLLKALKDGTEVLFRVKHFSYPMNDGGLGLAMGHDRIYAGVTFVIDVGEPAAKKRLDQEAEKRRLGF